MKWLLGLVILIAAGCMQSYGQSLSGSTWLFGQYASGSSTSPMIYVQYTGTGQDEALGGTPLGPGMVAAAGVKAAPPYLLRTSTGSSVGGIYTSSAYPFDFSSERDDLPFVGAYSNYNLGNSSTASIRWLYGMVAPNKLSASPATACGNGSVYISSGNNWPLFDDQYVKSYVVFEYNIVGTSAWKPIDSVSTYGGTYGLSFVPSQKIPEIRSGTKNVRFQSKVKAVYSNKTYYSAYSAASSPIEILAPAPALNVSRIETKMTCAGESNGAVRVPVGAVTSANPTMRWILRPGNVTNPCFPDGTSNCGNGIAQSEGAVPVSTTEIAYSGLAAGTYTLWFVNPGEELRSCFSSYSFTIGSFPAVAIAEDQGQHKNISCYNANDGRLRATATGGDPAGQYYFTLLRSDNTIYTGEQAGNGASLVWDNLPAGKYKLRVRNDRCSDVQTSQEIELTQPPQMTGTISLVQPTCNVPGNGAVTVTANAGGVASFRYELYKGGVLQQQSGVVPDRSYTFSGLTGGNYAVQFYNNDVAGCPPWVGNTTLDAPVPLTLVLASRDSVSCYGGSDGKLRFTASGGTGVYTYTLSGGTIGTRTSTDGLFENLPAGDYTIQLTNQASGCNDLVAQPVSVFQRSQLTIQLQPAGISCYGFDDAAVRALVNGGSGSYRYKWQQLKNGVWMENSFWFETDTKIDALAAGTYRVVITDAKANGCTVTADEVVINDVTALKITDITVTDAVCLADGVHIVMTATGGTGAYTYSLSTNGGTTFTPFTAATKLTTSGAYHLQVTDANGCVTPADDVYNVALPAAALDFSTTVSDYHGYNISCKNAADGRITVNATGGNGGAFSGYEYSLNGGKYQASPVFDQLGGNSYTISVKDGRGCEVSKTINLTEPDMKEVTLTKADIACNGAATGKLTVDITGGAGAYNLTVNSQAVTAGTTLEQLSAGVYDIHITDANVCPVDTSITLVNTYPALTIDSAVITAIICYDNTARIDIGATGGDGVHHFSLSTDNWSSATSYTSGAALTAGSYALRLTDGQGCIINYPDILEITAPAAPLRLTAILSEHNGFNISCKDAADGIITVQATGGNGGSYVGYQYSINGVAYQASPVFDHLGPGDYTVSVKDGRGCIASVTTTLKQSDMQVNLTKTDVTCNGDATGTLTVQVTGGTTTYSLTVNGQAVTAGTTLQQLPAGIYNIHITDANGCPTDTSITIVNTYPALTIDSAVVKDIVCYGTTGRIDLGGSGGDGIHTFSLSTDNWNSAVNYTSGAVLTPGDYALRLTDGQGCITSYPDILQITAPASPFSFTVSLSDYNGYNVTCAGSNGVITVNATGGNGGKYTGYQYSIGGRAYQSSPVFDHLRAGTYTISVKDARGCESSTTVTLVQSDMKVALTKTDIICNGAATGTLTTVITGGAGSYSLTVNGRTVMPGTTLQQLSAGRYDIHITDANGCPIDTNITIVYTYPALHIDSAVVTDIVCYGTKGRINIGASGGDGMYTFSLSTDNWNSASTYTTGAALDAGNYKLRLTDGQGCMTNYTDNLKVTAPASPLTFTTTLSNYNGYNISCMGGNNGTAAITAAGGNGASYSGYTYAVDGGMFTTDTLFKQLNAGKHTFSVKDARGCVLSKDVVLTAPATAINLTLVSRQQVPCASLPVGSITVTGSGGTGGLQYSIDNLNWQSAATFNGLVAGAYTVMVRDQNGCVKTLSTEIVPVNPPIVIDSITVNDIVCYGQKGTIQVRAHGGTGSLTSEYAWNGGNYDHTFNNTTPMGAGTYTIRIKDAAGCYSAVSAVKHITAPSTALDVAVTTTDYNGLQISCYGRSDGSISLAATGGNGGSYNGYKYSINNSAYATANTYTNLTAGNYSIKVSDGRGCELVRQVVLQQPAAALTLAVSSKEDLTCEANPTGMIGLQAGGGTAPYTYAMNGGSWQQVPVFAALPANTYALQVKDVNGCMANVTEQLNAMYPPITATATIDDVTCNGLADGSLAVMPTGGDGQYTYEWNVAGLSGHTVKDLPAGTYTVKITDGAGCFSSFTNEVGQPTRLQLEVDAPAVCDGQNGSIDAYVSGGIAPYKYSLNQSSWLPAGSFTQMEAGQYNIRIQDQHGCEIAQDFAIEKRNVKPDVNFLVASRRNALDTLVLKEISVPAPDHVSWSYSPAATFLGYEPDGTPLIKFAAPGTYWVEMTGTFGECIYSERKEVMISPYDPLAGPGYTVPVRVIDTVMMSPNPNNGNFSFTVKLNRKQQVVAYVYDMNGIIAGKRQYAPALQIDDKFSVGGTATRTFILRIITESESRDVRFIISR
ncbi:SprB repeat-containing protein [Chitinophaga agri]|uniref:Uncharacterized protein n=1 Tax=Chitinophaga agri TaxID=2703787 RepID=A0A6B9ZQ50_9BACT|nr:SprB repeat-containing protein [Chitinophaga agri]QHS63415.1 hypothetical protein GWR21_28655 [Chitinophaga agri]